VIIACVLQDVVAPLTVAYDILVGALLVPILGGLVWRPWPSARSRRWRR
jgi:solute:Na+ symporter, SSS family